MKKLPEKIKTIYLQKQKAREEAIIENVQKGNRGTCRSRWVIGFADGMEETLKMLGYDLGGLKDEGR